MDDYSLPWLNRKDFFFFLALVSIAALLNGLLGNPGGALGGSMYVAYLYGRFSQQKWYSEKEPGR